jgi:hypothetical protein
MKAAPLYTRLISPDFWVQKLHDAERLSISAPSWSTISAKKKRKVEEQDEEEGRRGMYGAMKQLGAGRKAALPPSPRKGQASAPTFPA